MTSTEVTIDDHHKRTKKGFFGTSSSTSTTSSSKKEASAVAVVVKQEQAKTSDDGSVASTCSQRKKTSWLGKTPKRPRAEYQAEIDGLKIKIAELETMLESTSIELEQFKDWMKKAPSAVEKAPSEF